MADAGRKSRKRGLILHTDQIGDQIGDRAAHQDRLAIGTRHRDIGTHPFEPAPEKRHIAPMRRARAAAVDLFGHGKNGEFPRLRQLGQIAWGLRKRSAMVPSPLAP